MIHTTTSVKKIVLKFLEPSIFSRFGCPRAIFNDGVTHFNNFQLRKLLKRYGFHHTSTTPYHPQANKEIMKILQKIFKLDEKGLSKKIYV